MLLQFSRCLNSEVAIFFTFVLLCSDDPWAGCLHWDCGEILFGYSRIAWKLRLRWPNWDGFLHLLQQCHSGYISDERRNGVSGGHCPWSLLEDRPRDPPPQALSSMDDESCIVPAVVERSCDTLRSHRYYHENCQRDVRHDWVASSGMLLSKRLAPSMIWHTGQALDRDFGSEQRSTILCIETCV